MMYCEEFNSQADDTRDPHTAAHENILGSLLFFNHVG